MDKLNQVKPRRYRYKQTPELMRMNFPTGERFGFVAQEMESIFPEVVSDNVAPLPVDPSLASSQEQQVITYKGINYTELIPLLVQAIQEQQAQIEALEASLQALQRGRQ